VILELSPTLLAARTRHPVGIDLRSNDPSFHIGNICSDPSISRFIPGDLSADLIGLQVGEFLLAIKISCKTSATGRTTCYWHKTIIDFGPAAQCYALARIDKFEATVIDGSILYRLSKERWEEQRIEDLSRRYGTTPQRKLYNRD